jgi:cholesterol transport system auxiliary component
VKESCLARAAVLLAFVLASALPSGCALGPAAAPPTIAVLTATATGLPRQDARPAVLVVFPPRGSPLFDTARMAYTARAHEIDYFSQYEWGETPARMLQPLLVATLRDLGLFSSVVTPPYAGRHAWGLRTEVRELIADFNEEPAVVRLTLGLQLIEGDTQRVEAERQITARERLRERTPDAVVDAANAATATALRETARFLLAATP